MAELLDAKDRAKLGGGRKAGGDKGVEKLPELLPFDMWSKAWNRYQAILIKQAKALGMDRGDTLGEDMAHHLEMVTKIKAKNANWGFYEREFRQLVARGEARWGSSHLELLLHTFLLENDGARSDIGARPLPQARTLTSIPAGACYQYHRTGSCIKHRDICRFQHACFNCLRPHPASTCPQPMHPPFKIMERFRPRAGGFRQQASGQGQQPFRANWGQGPRGQQFGPRPQHFGAGGQVSGQAGRGAAHRQF